MFIIVIMIIHIILQLESTTTIISSSSLSIIFKLGNPKQSQVIKSTFVSTAVALDFENFQGIWN